MNDVVYIVFALDKVTHFVAPIMGYKDKNRAEARLKKEQEKYHGDCQVLWVEAVMIDAKLTLDKSVSLCYNI